MTTPEYSTIQQIKKALFHRFGKLGIRSKILLTFSVFSIGALILISSVIGGFYRVANNLTKEESENALTNQIQTNMITSASENAKTIEEKLRSAVNQVKAMADFATNLFNHPNIYGNYPSYNDTDTTPSALLLQYQVPGYGPTYISFEYSMYHLAPTIYNGLIGYESANASVQNVVNLSANLDHIFRYTKTANPAFGWIYMGFEVGVFRCYPWSMFSPTFDPRLRPWYGFSFTERTAGIKITNPYIDANGLGLMITIAKQIFYTNGTQIGVIAADLTIDTIQQSILDISFLQSGYAFLINTDGLVIAHPELEEPNLGEDLDTVVLELEPIPLNLYNSIVSQTNGYGEFQKTMGNQIVDYYLAFSKISGTKYIVVTVVPRTEALESVGLLQEEIFKATRTITTTLIIIIIFAGVVSVGLGTIIAGQITKPVKVLTEAVQKLTRIDTFQAIIQSKTYVLIDPTLESQDDEIGDLTRAFKGMIQTIKNDRTNQS